MVIDRLQGTVDEIQFIKEDIIAVLHRHRHLTSPTSSTLSKTKRTPWRPVAAVAAGATIGPSMTSGIRRHLTISPSANKSASSGNVDSPSSPSWSSPGMSPRDNNQTGTASLVNSHPESQPLWQDITRRSASFSSIGSANQLPVSSPITLTTQPTTCIVTNEMVLGLIEGWQRAVARAFISLSQETWWSFKSAVCGFFVAIIAGVSMTTVVRMLDSTSHDDDDYQLDNM